MVGVDAEATSTTAGGPFPLSCPNDPSHTRTLRYLTVVSILADCPALFPTFVYLNKEIQM